MNISKNTKKKCAGHQSITVTPIFPLFGYTFKIFFTKSVTKSVTKKCNLSILF